MNQASGSIIGHLYSYTAPFPAYSTDYDAYAGRSSYDGGKRWVYSLMFSTPNFVGVSEELMFDITMCLGIGLTAELRYAICVSDSNLANYLNTTEAVSDENQVATGILSFTDMPEDPTNKNFKISTTRLKSKTIYYLVLWSAGDSGVTIKSINNPAYDKPTVTLGYNIGLVYIKTADDEAPEPHQAYIYNGEVWELYIPNIRGDDGWDQCG